MFFFNQNTAYEMRISDWSSDVCSSDLPSPIAGVELERARALDRGAVIIAILRDSRLGAGIDKGPRHRQIQPEALDRNRPPAPPVPRVTILEILELAEEGQDILIAPAAIAHIPPRSEEHTSELQSLMRISYAV